MTAAKDDLLAALRRSKKALAAFEAMPPSHRERWVAFVAEAKKEETRARRIAQCLQELAKGETGGSSSGYSGKPLLQKLGIKEGHRVALLEAPAKLPDGLAPVRAAATPGAGPFDVIVLFAESRAALAQRFRPAARLLHPSGGLWVAWPKRASGVSTDLTEDVVREIALAAGLVDNKVCAIDELWSGLRCVYRLKDRPGARTS